MGESAYAMINGEMCQDCGCYIGEPVGRPRSCKDCKRDARLEQEREGKVPCYVCGKAVTAQGLDEHVRAKHPGAV